MKFIVLKQRNKYDIALKWIKKAIQIDKQNIKYLGEIGILNNNLFQTGNILTHKGNLEQAKIYYQECLQLDSKDVFTLCEIGYIYYIEKDCKTALTYYQEAISIKKEITIMVDQTDALLELEQFEECLKQCQLVINTDPTLIRPYLIKISIFIYFNQLQEAYEQILILKQLDQSRLWSVDYNNQLNYFEYYFIGKHLREKNKHQQSIYYQFLSLQNNPVFQLGFLGSSINDSYFQICQISKAMKLINFKQKVFNYHIQVKEFLDGDIDSSKFMTFYIKSQTEIAHSLLQLKLYQNYLFVIDNIAQILQIEQIYNSDFSELREYVILVLLLICQNQDAWNVYLKFHDDSKEKDKLEFNLVYLYQQNGQAYDEFLLNAIQNDIEELNIDLVDGYFLFQRNNFNEARQYFKDKIFKDPQNLDAHLMLGNINQKLQLYPKSIKEFDCVIEIEKTNNWAYIQKAYSYYCMGQTNQIYPIYKEACQYCPDDYQLIRCIALYLYESELFEQAFELFNLLFDQYSNYEIDDLYFRYGILFVKQGLTFYQIKNKENALKIFNIVKTYHYSFRLFIHQGRKYEKNQPLFAIQFYTDLLTIFDDQSRSYFQWRIKILTDQLHKEQQVN